VIRENLPNDVLLGANFLVYYFKLVKTLASISGSKFAMTSSIPVLPTPGPGKNSSKYFIVVRAVRAVVESCWK
jgi:hypothetical protein